MAGRLACSPDMNPIEHCWDELGRAVRQCTRPGDTLADLRRYLTEEWSNIPQARIRSSPQHEAELLRMH